MDIEIRQYDEYAKNRDDKWKCIQWFRMNSPSTMQEWLVKKKVLTLVMIICHE